MLAVAVGLLAPAPIFSQSGATGGRASARAYGVNLTFAVYQYDDMRSPAIEEVTRLSGTFSSAEDEIAHIKDRHKLEGVEIRHVREVGLRGSEGFLDAVLLGPQYMDFRVTPQEVARGYMKLDMRVRYGNEPVLDVKGVEFDNFETVLLRGGKGMFGVKYFIGAGGRQESAAIERTLLISVTAEIVPETGLRNRPQQLSQAVDEYGSPIKLTKATASPLPWRSNGWCRSSTRAGA